MRAGLYARVSREEQLEGYSINAQLEAMRRFCQERGWEIVAEYVEPGASGTTADRPAFQSVMADCEAGKLDVLVTHQLDRFHRNLRLQLDTFGKLAEWKVAYVSVTEQIDYSTPQGMLFLQMLGAFNEYYVANLRREVRKGKRGRARSGMSNASTIPYGYIRVEGRDVPQPDAAAIIRCIFKEYASDSYSLQGLAEWLNQEGLPASTRSRGVWTRQSVRYVLTNPFYVGLVRHGEDLYPGQHEPLVTQEVFDATQAVLGRRSRVRTGRRTGLVYLLQGIAYCSHCGEKLYAERHRWGRYYRCSSKGKGMLCPARYTRAEPVEEQVTSLLQALQLPEDWRRRVIELANNEEEKWLVERERKNVLAVMKRLRQQHRWELIDDDEFLAEHGQLQARLESLVTPETPAVEEAGVYLEHIGGLWDTLTLAERQEATQAMLKAVHIDPITGEVTGIEFHHDFAPLIGQVEVRREQED